MILLANGEMNPIKTRDDRRTKKNGGSWPVKNRNGERTDTEPMHPSFSANNGCSEIPFCSEWSLNQGLHKALEKFEKEFYQILLASASFLASLKRRDRNHSNLVVYVLVGFQKTDGTELFDLTRIPCISKEDFERLRQASKNSYGMQKVLHSVPGDQHDTDKEWKEDSKLFLPFASVELTILYLYNKFLLFDDTSWIVKYLSDRQLHALESDIVFRK